MDQRPIRQAVRAVVLDPLDRVFLVQMQLPHVTFWSTPGGGVEDGESFTDALQCELREEVGSADFGIGPLIWSGTHLWDMDSAYKGQTNMTFLVRVDSPELGDSLFSADQLRAELVIDRRWWTLPELQSATTEFSPRRLPGLLVDLIASGPPDEPMSNSQYLWMRFLGLVTRRPVPRGLW